MSFRLNGGGADTSSTSINPNSTSLINLLPNGGTGQSTTTVQHNSTSLSLFTPPSTHHSAKSTPGDLTSSAHHLAGNHHHNHHHRHTTASSYLHTSNSSSTPLKNSQQQLLDLINSNSNKTASMSTTNVAAAAAAAAASTATSTMSKSKKLGQILKLASVRGAKSKSMKHKYSTGQLQSHSFISVTTDANCHVCHKSMSNKKALHCKRKCILGFCLVANKTP